MLKARCAVQVAILNFRLLSGVMVMFCNVMNETWYCLLNYKLYYTIYSHTEETITSLIHDNQTLFYSQSED